MTLVHDMAVVFVISFYLRGLNHTAMATFLGDKVRMPMRM